MAAASAGGAVGAQAATALIASHELSGWRNMLPQVRHRARQAPPCTDPMAHSLLTEHEATAGLISAEETMRRVRSILAAPTDPGLQLYLLASLATLAQWADEFDFADIWSTGGCSYTGTIRCTLPSSAC